MDFPTVHPTMGIRLNDTKTDIALLWAEDDPRVWARAALTAGMQQIKGQWRYDTREGIDYLGQVFAHAPSARTVSGLFRLFLASQWWVQEVIDCRARIDGENAHVDWAVRVGELTITGSTDLLQEPYPYVFSSEFSAMFG